MIQITLKQIKHINNDMTSTSVQIDTYQTMWINRDKIVSIIKNEATNTYTIWLDNGFSYYDVYLNEGDLV